MLATNGTGAVAGIGRSRGGGRRERNITFSYGPINGSCRSVNSCHILVPCKQAGAIWESGHLDKARLFLYVHCHPFIRLLYCVVGAVCGITFALRFAGPTVGVFFLASLGGSSVFLFGLTRAAAAQPRALFGGHLGGAAIGIACYHALGDAPWVYGLAQGLALAFMLATRTVHPPAGTNPILMIYVHAGWSALFLPVFVGVLSLALCAALWSRLYPGLVHYPVSWLECSPSGRILAGWAEANEPAANADHRFPNPAHGS